MTTIICKLRDSGGSPLTGFVRVISEYIINDEVTGVVTLPAPKDFELVNGDCTFTLQDTALARVSYRFEVWQVVTNGTGIIWTFNAQVPASIEPIFLTDLAATGITKDALDTSILTITRRILADSSFWDRLKNDVLKWRGNFNPATFYRKGDGVAYLGSSFVYINDQVKQGQVPFENFAHWLKIAEKGDPGNDNINGSNTPYGISWQHSLSAPSQNAVFNKLQQMASLVNPVFSSPSISHTLPASESSKVLASTEWVKEQDATLRGLAIQDMESRDATVYNNAVSAASAYTQSIRSGVFRTGTYTTSNNFSVTANAYHSFFQLPITVRDNSQGILVTASSNLLQSSGANQQLSYRVILSSQVSDRAMVTTFSGISVSARMTEIFAALPAGSYTVFFQVMLPVATTMACEVTNLRAAVLY